MIGSTGWPHKRAELKAAVAEAKKRRPAQVVELSRRHRKGTAAGRSLLCRMSHQRCLVTFLALLPLEELWPPAITVVDGLIVDLACNERRPCQLTMSDTRRIMSGRLVF